MKLADLLQEKKAAIADRWLKEIYATYPKDVSHFLRREKDRFANPAGHALRAGTRAILDGVLEGMEAEKVCRHLDDVLKIRAIQEFTPSRAVSFVFLLKKAVRAELGKAAGDPRLAAELAGFEEGIDQVALFAFDIYVRNREKVYELRINEVKRSVSAIMKRMNGCGSDSEEAGLKPAPARRGADR